MWGAKGGELVVGVGWKGAVDMKGVVGEGVLGFLVVLGEADGVGGEGVAAEFEGGEVIVDAGLLEGGFGGLGGFPFAVPLEDLFFASEFGPVKGGAGGMGGGDGEFDDLADGEVGGGAGALEGEGLGGMGRLGFGLATEEEQGEGE